MSSALPTTATGRLASLARRRALSQGKSALPPPKERVRTGHRTAALPAGASAVAQPVPSAPVAPPAPARSTVAPIAASGRQGSMLRRRLLSAGKQALAAGTTTNAPAAPPAAAAPVAKPPTPPQPAAGQPGSDLRVLTPVMGTGRDLARLRRQQRSQFGRAAPAQPPTWPPRQGSIEYAPKVAEAATHARQRVTGLRIGLGDKVTGIEPGARLPITGTQYVGLDEAAVRAAGPKVGLARTARGLTVSGTLVRSRVAITGDEPGQGQRVTGEVDPRPEDDLTPRPDRAGGPQFARAADPHGASVFGRFRARSTPGALELTVGGQPVTGTAVGRSARVTGDEDGACCAITGDQYFAPAARASECGGRGGGTAPREHVGAARPDPVTGAKVMESRTWGGQRVTGPDVEHRPAVTGDEPGSCSVITGTQYQGPSTMAAWCDPARAEAAAARVTAAPAQAPVSGDVPLNSAAVTGTERGAQRAITGTPYYRDDPAIEPAGDDGLARIARSFSVSPPQRQAQLRALRDAPPPGGAGQRITGAFAIGADKVTGSVEFAYRTRQPAQPDAKRARITGEGRTEGPAITGDAWTDHARVTGTEGYIAAGRNPSERAGKPHGWAGAGRFKDEGKHEPPRQIVTGMVGWTAKSAAKVTLSGGAQG